MRKHAKNGSVECLLRHVNNEHVLKDSFNTDVIEKNIQFDGYEANVESVFFVFILLAKFFLA